MTTVTDIREWLQQKDFARFADVFEENEIDLAALPSLTEDHLKELEIPLGPRVKMLNAIAALRSGLEPLPPAETSAQHASSTHEAERRQVTVMFADLADSTSLSGSLDPEDLRDVLKAYQSAVAGAVKQYGGNVAKYMGDGVLCYFGWPAAHEDDAERACRAGLQTVQETASLRTPQGAALSARVGLATGLVVVGDLIGEGAAQENAIVGETPNLSARLQSTAKPGQVVVDGLTRQLAGSRITCEDLGLREFKGIAKPTQVWSAVGETADSDAELLARQRRSVVPSVGRDHEANLLDAKWQLAKDGEGQAVLLSGEAGIGKSHLVQLMVDATKAENVFRMRFQCSPHHVNTALYPIGRQFEFASGMTAGDSDDQKLDKLEALLALSGQDNNTTAALFADMLGLPSEHRYGALELTAEQRQSQTFAAMIAQTLTLSSNKPVLVVFEDTHWLDPTTTLLVGRTIAAVADAPVLLVLTCRSEFANPWQGHPHLSALNLNRLGRKSSLHLARAVSEDGLPEKIALKIAERSGGIPLFVEELSRSVMEKIAAGETEHTDDLIPETLQGLLASKLDGLGKSKPVAQLAAVIGREFDARTIAIVAEETGLDVDGALKRLMQSGLVLQSGSMAREVYRFKHALIRDAAYESLLRERRKELHARVAEALETQYAENTKQQAPALAMHYSEAQLPDKAVPYHIDSGDVAVDRNAFVEARAHFDDALQLARDLPRSEHALRLQIRATLKRARVASGKEHFENDLADLEIARELAESIGHQPRLSQVLYWIGRTHYVLGQHGQVAKFVESAFEIGEALGDPKLTAAPLNLIGRSQFFTDPKAAAETLARSVEEMHGLGDQVEEAGALGMLSVSYMLIGQFEDAIAAANKSVELAEQIEHLPTLAAAKYYRGDIFGWIGNMKRCVEDFEHSKNLAEEAGDQFRVYLVHGERGFPYILDGNWLEADKDLSKCVALAAQIGTNFVLGKYQAFLAQVRLHQGRTAEAIDLARGAVQFATEGNQPWPRIVAARTLALVLATADAEKIDEAESMADTAIALAQEREMLPDLAWSILVKAKVLQVQGEMSAAEQELRRAADHFKGMGLERELKRANRELKSLRKS